MNTPGRSCPLHYRYRPETFRRPAELHAETLYVVGGLYGNVEALHTVLAMKRREERAGRRVTLMFNGDFNWFNCEPAGFAAINETVLEHGATLGNVEAELCGEGGEAGCGCNYPAYVDQGTVERSNAILTRLRETAAGFPGILRALAALPMTRTVAVGDEPVGILHGDPESLAGWSFAAEAMEPLDHGLRARLGCNDNEAVTPLGRAAAWFRAAGVRVFAGTHTCLPFAQDLAVDGQQRLIINNGAAGMPNFQGTRYGVLTRLSVHPETPAGSLYGANIGPLRCDALPIPYDHGQWLRRFTGIWPRDSAAWTSYHRRICGGPGYELAQAVRGSVRPTHAERPPSEETPPGGVCRGGYRLGIPDQTR